jgi:hypothetical protein
MILAMPYGSQKMSFGLDPAWNPTIKRADIHYKVEFY